MRRIRGDLAGAMDDLRRSLDIRERINDRHLAAETLLEIAATLRVRNDSAGALEAARKATSHSRETGGRETLMRARVTEGEILEVLGDKSAAREAYAEAVDLVEELRGDAAGGEQERQRFLEGRLAPFQRLSVLLAAEGHAAEALEMAEQAKARVMLDVLRAGRAEFTFLTLEERERQRQLERNMSVAHARGLRDAWLKTRIEEAEFRTSLYEKYPALKLSLGDAKPGSLHDAAAIIDDAATALLEFMVTPDATYAFVVTRGASGNESLACFTIKVTEEALRRETGQFRQQLAARDLEFEDTARKLYRLLLGQVDLRGKTNLIIVPDGPLWEIPFQTLTPRPKHFLIEDAAISVVPSIGVLRETRARSERAVSRRAPVLLALADRLPATANQVRDLQQLYGTAQSRILVGDAAKQERFVAEAGNATVLHLATHGVLDDKSPMYSFLQLADSSTGEAARDGRLEAWEIMKLNLHADVTVLAGCETGRGRVGAGEGVIGLAWAFFLAGSPRTVVSLWKVEAESTSDLMVAFHRRLRTNLTRTPGHPGAAASLRAAALSLLRDPRYRHPFYWAGFVVVGDGS
jgi:CHAT domain-containing protein